MEHLLKDINIFNLLMVMLGFLLARTLNKIDKNQAALFERMTRLEQNFYELLGEHKARSRRDAAP